MKRYYFLVLFLGFLAFKSVAQNPLNGRFYITGASETPLTAGSNYTIEGRFTDPFYIYSASDIMIGDMIADYSGLVFKIDKINEVTGDQIMVDVTYVSGSMFEGYHYPASYQTGTLFRPTSKGYPIATYDSDNLNDNLVIAVQNAAIRAIDADLTGIKSGTSAEFPTDSKLGDMFYNTDDSKIYIFNGNDWILLGGGLISSGTQFDFPDPAKLGEMFFNLDDNSIYIYNGSLWFKVSTNGSNPTGNANPDPNHSIVNRGNLFYNTSDNRLYVFNGSVWAQLDNFLPEGRIYIGDEDNVATPVFMSGEATLTEGGELTINNRAITNEKLAKDLIPLSGFGLPNNNVAFGDATTKRRITFLANPTASTDAATKGYVDDLFLTPSLLSLPNNNFFVGNPANKAVATPKTSIALSGFGPATTIVSLGGNKLVSVADPTTATDAATKGYVDKSISNIKLTRDMFFIGGTANTATEVAKNAIPLSGFGAAIADISFGNGPISHNIINLKDPVNAQDAATKNYIDKMEFAPERLLLAENHLFKGNAAGKGEAVAQGALSLSGFGVPQTDVSFGDKVLTNLGAPISTTDAATKGYIDGLFANPDGTLALALGNLFVGDAQGAARSTPKNLISISGFGQAENTVDMGDHPIANVLDPIENQDAATKKYVDEKTANPSSIQLPTDHILVGDGGQAQAILKGAVPVSDFGYATENLELGKAGEPFHKIINLADPTEAQDAATKAYVDSKGVNSGGDLPVVGDSKPGDIFYNTTDNKLYVFDGDKWVVIGSEGGSVDVPNGPTPPASPKAGDMFYNTTENILYVYDGKGWVPMGNDTDGNAILDLQEGHIFVGDGANKAEAVLKNKVPISDFGIATNTLSLGNGTNNFRIANLADPIKDQDAATKAYVDSKGINSGSDVPAVEDSKAGDMYYDTTNSILYVFNGTDWMPLVNELAKDHFFIGDDSNRPIAISKENISISGFGTATDTLSLGNGTDNFRIANLGTPIKEFDAVTKKYVDDATNGITDGFMKTDIYDIDKDGIVDNAATVNFKTIESDVPENAVFTDDLVKVGETGKGLYLSEADFEVAQDASGKDEIVLKKFDISKFEPIGDKTMLGNISGADASPEALTAGEVRNLLELSNVDDTRDADKHVLSATKLDPPLIINGNEYDGTADFTIDGDNLGSHTAEKNITLGDWSISKDGVLGGLSFDENGHAIFAQDVTVRSNFYTPSDQRLKTNIETLTEALASLDQLRGVRFEYIDQKKYMVGSKVGLIAQELQKVYPEMVSQGSDGFLKVDNTQLSAVLIQAVKEQQEQLRVQAQEIESLKNRMSKQEAQIEAILKKIRE